MNINWFQFGQQVANGAIAGLSNLTPTQVQGVVTYFQNVTNPNEQAELNMLSQAEALLGMSPSAAISLLTDVLKEPGLPTSAAAEISSIVTVLSASNAPLGSAAAAASVQGALSQIEQAKTIIKSNG